MPAFQPRRPLRALFLHRNFPAQFEHLAPALAERMGVQVISMGQAEVPRLPGGMVPLRSVEIAAPQGEVEARLETGAGGLTWSGDLAVLVQAVGGETCRAHVLVRDGTDVRAASRDLERFRRLCEGR